MPIYLVTVQAEPVKTILVDAPTKAGAIHHVVNDMVSAAALTAREVAVHMQAGAQLQTVPAKTKGQPNE